MPLKSKAQQRYMFAKHPRMAKRWAHETPNIKELPEKVKESVALFRGFSSELEKLAKKSAAAKLQSLKARQKEKSEATTREAKAQMALMGTSAGLGVTVMALMKSPGQPGTAEAMTSHVHEMAKKMGLPEAVNVLTPGSFQESGWSPYYNPLEKEVNIPLHTRDSIIAHELGHAKNDLLAAQAGLGVRLPYQGVEMLSRIASGLTLAPTLAASASSKVPSYKPGVIQAILSSPMILEEAAASARATAHLMEQHGTGKGLFKSLPLVPAFATYLAVGGAPLLVTYLRKRKLLQEHEREVASRKKAS